MTFTHLFTPLNIGALTLANRMLMAPLTRCRADENHVPTALMAEHYSQRASAGLIIAEATAAMDGCSAFGAEPGIYNDAQVAGWKLVTDAVHAKGGQIVLQIWHGGRACHPLLNGGKVPVAPSAIAITNDEIHTPDGKFPYTVPRALLDEEIPTIIAGFKTAAINAKAAGFDGVEIHAANGYLLDEFLRDGSNKRSGAYGGSIENRARFAIEVAKAIVAEIGADRTGIRISPMGGTGGLDEGADAADLYRYLVTELNKLGLAYLHILHTGQDKLIEDLRQIWKGPLLINRPDATPENLDQDVKTGLADLVPVGKMALANPDLVARLQKKAALNAPNPATFFSPGPAGYTDYPTLAA